MSRHPSGLRGAATTVRHSTPILRRVPVRLPHRGYSIVVGSGSLDRLGTELTRLGISKRGLVIADRNAWRFHGPRLEQALRGFATRVVVVPAGERSKSLRQAERLYRALQREAIGREDFVLAFGGGVIGDLSGFAAATWHRGIALIMVPTTLLAQVDSAVGGKVGVNFGGIKNLVGAFHQPKLVLSDPTLLATLPPREYRSALAEVVKYGMIAAPSLLRRLERNESAALAADPRELTELITLCCRIKASIVTEDEREGGERLKLNYGHTLGHALEAAANGRLRHGEAVALGMRGAARLAERLGYLTPAARSRQDRLLDRLGLPRRLRGVSVADVARKMKWDKKVRAGKVRFVLTGRVGSASLAPPIERRLVREVLAELVG